MGTYLAICVHFKCGEGIFSSGGRTGNSAQLILNNGSMTERRHRHECLESSPDHWYGIQVGVSGFRCLDRERLHSLERCGMFVFG